MFVLRVFAPLREPIPASSNVRFADLRESTARSCVKRRVGVWAASRLHMIPFIRCLLLFFASVSALRAQDGIYADFSTSLGNFTCQLHYDRTPRTVANFIALASGSRAWLDIPTGDAKPLPYFNGLTFHRVVSGFVIQGGSPNGNGTDGPGYTFQDEFHPTLRHDGEGVLSMANSGLHSNGSQFFVTLAATPHLNDVHSVFGNVTSGIEVVRAIGMVPVDGSSKPITPVLMNSVAIRRVGAAALAFNEHAQGLPTVSSANPVLLKQGASFLLRFNREANHDYRLYYGSNLQAWTRQALGIYLATQTADIDVTPTTAGQPRFFYRVPRISYPPPIYSPSGLPPGATLTLTSPEGTATYSANAQGAVSVTWSVTGSTGGLQQGTWSQEAYRVRLATAQATVGLAQVQVDLVFTSAGAGTFKGLRSPNNAFNGTFTYVTP
jgi:peptidyl-prolyl cis-trans isomerase A (cyclophilin A)